MLRLPEISNSRELLLPQAGRGRGSVMTAGATEQGGPTSGRLSSEGAALPNSTAKAGGSGKESPSFSMLPPYCLPQSRDLHRQNPVGSQSAKEPGRVASLGHKAGDSRAESSCRGGR